MNRACIQLSGELRNWSLCSKYWKAVKKEFELNNIELDILLYTWKDEYTSKVAFDKSIFSLVELIEYPERGYLNKSVEEKGGRFQSTGLYLYSYAIFKAYLSRKEYQRVNQIDYDVIYITRPDGVRDIDFYIQEVKHYRDYPTHMTVHMEPINTTYAKSIYQHRSSDDNMMYGSQETVDLYSTHFNILYGKDINLVLNHHINPAIAVMKYNLLTNNRNVGTVRMVRTEDMKNFNGLGEPLERAIAEKIKLHNS